MTSSALKTTTVEASNVVIDKNAKIYIAGHRGMVGSAILRRLQRGGYTRLITRTREELDLLEQRAVFDFLDVEKPEYIVMAAARVGGIHANNKFHGAVWEVRTSLTNRIARTLFALESGVMVLLHGFLTCSPP